MVFTYANKHGQEAWPGVDRLVDDTGMSRRTVQRCLSSLEKLGWLHVVKRGRKGRDGVGKYTRYELKTGKSVRHPRRTDTEANAPSETTQCAIDDVSSAPPMTPVPTPVPTHRKAHSEPARFSEPTYLRSDDEAELDAILAPKNGDQWGSYLRDHADDCPI